MDSETACGEALFTRSGSVARRIESLIDHADVSIDCALYRLEHPLFARALGAAARRGVRVRLVLDRGKFCEGRSVIENNGRVAWRISSGRSGDKSKMHHKFAVFDGEIAVTGSYNWTEESESANFENLLVLRTPALVNAYRQEFESLWAQSEEAAERG